MSNVKKLELDRSRNKDAVPLTRGRQAIVESKLSPYKISANLLSLARLEQTFDTALVRRLICLTAPAGYGKTVTLGKLHAFAQERGRKTVWISLDADDNDPVRFFQYLMEAFRQTLSDAEGIPRFDFAGSAGMPSVEEGVLSICDELARTNERLAVFLDDYHLIENDAIHQALDWLINHSPRRHTFVIASRVRIPLKLSKLRLTQDVYELNAEDMSLQPDEAACFVRERSRRELTAMQIRSLHERTEGWIAGLQLALSAMENVADINEFIDSYSGSDRTVTAYLGEIILANLPGSIGSFLMRTALFDRFSIELCYDVLMERDAGHLFEVILGKNLFLLPLDRKGKWYRYHHLFGEYLRNRFVHSSWLEAQQLYRAGSSWFELHGSKSEAIRYAFAAHDYDHAVDLIADYDYELVQLRGEMATLLQWVAMLPRPHLEQNPQIWLSYIGALILSHRYADAELEFSRLDQAIDATLLQDTYDGDKTASLVRKASMMRCVLYSLTGRYSLASQKSAEWLSMWRSKGDPVDEGAILNVAGYTAFVRRDYDQAGRFFTTAKDLFGFHASYYGQAYAEVLHALILLELGNVNEAEFKISTTRAILSEKLGRHSHGLSLLSIIYAHICYEQNRVDEAEQLLSGMALFANTRSFGDTSAVAHITAARILWLRGSFEEADHHLTQGALAAERVGVYRTTRKLHAERIHIHLKSGLLEQALRIAHSMGVSQNADMLKFGRDPSYDNIEGRVVDARLKLATGYVDRGQRLLNELLTEARRYQRNAWTTRLLCIKGVLHAQSGAQDDALRAINEALALGAVGGLCRTIADEDPMVKELVQEIAMRRKLLKGSDISSVPGEYLVQILHAFDRDEVQLKYPQPVKMPPTGRRNILSEREIEILRLVGEGLKNRDLARQLFLSEETVKGHLRNIYTKLNVNNRTSAVAKAREMSLI
ncbi:MAG TPA: LuxR C-terminal-related transcriptional regulator [Paucimonas sp.]|nr:LuxR C-terminal-related transcriptional regulator [Paucimonas sp.]